MSNMTPEEHARRNREAEERHRAERAAVQARTEAERLESERTRPQREAALRQAKAGAAASIISSLFTATDGLGRPSGLFGPPVWAADRDAGRAAYEADRTHQKAEHDAPGGVARAQAERDRQGILGGARAATSPDKYHDPSRGSSTARPTPKGGLSMGAQESAAHLRSAATDLADAEGNVAELNDDHALCDVEIRGVYDDLVTAGEALAAIGKELATHGAVESLAVAKTNLDEAYGSAKAADGLDGSNGIGSLLQAIEEAKTDVDGTHGAVMEVAASVEKVVQAITAAQEAVSDLRAHATRVQADAMGYAATIGALSAQAEEIAAKLDMAVA